MIDGDSMQLLLSSGDRILIDTAQRVPVPPGILRQKEICLVACVAKKRHSPAASKGSLSISLVRACSPVCERLALALVLQPRRFPAILFGRAGRVYRP
jgi:hypothetical protein